LDVAGFADLAATDTALAKAVANHKSIFFAEKNSEGKPIDYHAAVSGGLRLIPNDAALTKLGADYQRMIDDGLFLNEVESFDALLNQCRAIEKN
jgi:hypothetical protein